MAIDKLTDEQKKLVEDNYKLVYHMNQRYGLFKYIDDAEGILALGLCKAARLFDPSKGIFSTYACKAMLREVQYEIRKNKNRVHLVEEHRIITKEDHEEKGRLSVFDFTPDPEDRNAEFDLMTVSEKVLSEFNPKTAKVIRMYIYEDMTMLDIARELGYSSRTFICSAIHRYREKMEEYKNDIFNC